MSSHDLTAANGDKEHITPSPVTTPPLLTFSDTEEELNESFSDDPTDHNMNKSWLKWVVAATVRFCGIVSYNL